MRYLKWMLKALAASLLGLLGAVALYAGWASVAYPEIAPAELERRYFAEPVLTFNVDGVELRYQIAGERPDATQIIGSDKTGQHNSAEQMQREQKHGEQKTLLLLHSQFFSMTMWDEWFAELSHQFRVIRLDIPAHGLTGPDPSDDYSMARSQFLLEAFLAHLQVEQLAIVGSSFGGNLAFTYAANHPRQVSQLVLINSGGLHRANARSGEIPGWVAAVMARLPETAYRRFLQWMIVDDAWVSDRLVAQFHDMIRRRGNTAAILQMLSQFDVGDSEATLGRVTAPVLIMWGRDNPQLDYQSAEQFRALLTASPAVEVILYPGVGHLLPVEAPVQGLADLSAFLQRPTGQTKGEAL